MPEAGLARELGLGYATCAVVANWAAGRGEGVGEISMEDVEKNVSEGMVNVRRLLEVVIPTM
jgi:5'-methylthioinosine phosphorylase